MELHQDHPGDFESTDLGQSQDSEFPTNSLDADWSEDLILSLEDVEGGEVCSSKSGAGYWVCPINAGWLNGPAG